ncbi:Carboxymethylenebutenolidase-related protein [Serinicoccus hydrothermalis]|uniref:Carboxymethylenebutenolidase-related protein n=1 Tax=Serinicoccus hydrothermalis TaxID=1758689 RepID=A0A1B1NCR7_9MICO|nr:Carboxymethylenebutenolidase-related protein [Serinicoccus hydrothermalis]
MAWLHAVLGLVAVVVAAWIWLTRAGVLLAGHPAYLVSVTVVGLAGLALLVLAVRGARGRAGRARAPGWLRVLGRVALALVTVLVVGALAWLRPFPASPEATGLMSGDAGVDVTDSAGRITLTPTGAAPDDGLIFQPGARVDPRAYLPLLTEVAAQGHLVVVVKQPFDIGFTALGAPEGIIEDHPDVSRWSLGGHSLGGVVASAYAQDYPAEVDGLVLWASYPLGDLSDRDDLAASTIFGSNDGLATPADIEASRPDLPPGTEVVEIPGGVHAFFGDYGEQPGDGTPGVTREAAQDQIVEASLALLAAAGS